jgi:hypothetical protein
MFRLIKYLWMMVPFVNWFKKSETKVPVKTSPKSSVSTTKKPKKPRSPSKKVPAKKKSTAKKK